jgi:hypothetical protein
LAQQQWIVPGFGGQQYSIGLYHGIDSGHLMVHCNGEVLLIEFAVKDSKEFSFFLGEELYELIITKEASRFSYHLQHNEEIDSPHNRRRESEKKTDRWRLISLSVLSVLFLTGLALYLWNAPEREADLWAKLVAGEGEMTTAYITEKNGQWVANYRVDDQLLRIRLSPTDTVSKLGFPRRDGDQLTARYLPGSPHLLHIEWLAPTAEQLERYRELALLRHTKEHPELALRQVRCQVALAEALEGAAGLAKLHQQTVENFPVYNKNAYFRLVRSQAFRDGVKACL